MFEMIGFSRKDNAKRILKKHFKVDEDYKSVFLPREEYSKGGKPEEKITLNIKTFKKLYMLAKTNKGDTSNVSPLDRVNAFKSVL